MATRPVVRAGAFETGPGFIRDDNVSRVFPAAEQKVLCATSSPRAKRARPEPARNLCPGALPFANYLRFDPRGLRVGRPRPKYATDISPQLTAFFTSALILASSVAVNPFSAKATGHMAPSSRLAAVGLLAGCCVSFIIITDSLLTAFRFEFSVTLLDSD